MNNYNFLLLFFIFFGSYLFSYFLKKTQKISLMTHRRFWNIILLISFIISGLLGLILALFIDQKWSLLWYQPLLWSHVEFGIIMALVSIMHIFWHLRYFKTIFKK